MAKLGVSPHLTSIVADLSRELPDQLRYWRLLDAILSTLSCDAAALLTFAENSEPSDPKESPTLIPLAIDGLDDKMLDQRFRVDQHPRFVHWLQSPEAVYFPADSQLPNPFQQFLKTGDRRTGPRDSLGVALHVAGRPWGLLCLNSRQANTLNKIDDSELRTFITFIESAIAVLQRGKKLRTELQHQQRLNTALFSKQQNKLLLGNSPALKRVKEEIAIIAASELTILLQGEDGVGKSLVARDIHLSSSRSHQPFISVDCATLGEETAYAELFGGATNNTGNDKSRTENVGLFQLANPGTIFLNEVASLSAEVQSQLEKVLKTGCMQMLDSDRAMPLAVRLIAATRTNLQQAVSRGEFRPELYRLLMLYPLPVPPLRDRAEDIPLLTKHFLEQERRRLALPALHVDSDARQLLQHYSWPGNVRELDQVLRRATLKAMAEKHAATGVTIKISQLGINFTELPRAVQTELTRLPEQINLKQVVDDFQRRLINERLNQHHGNLAATARNLDLNRSNFYRLLQRLGIKETS
ncbi:MAG: sigma 54-interacting transcriptional regulator [Gammaproteobacteria bacterium]|nr:sigma 54-interacting transcriptional regulator [Gammaproteobacteria bacterium]MBQ0840571.1 sigma 54-interacting transcriptional regulator [Gammaproteobacteria bacterium]